MNPLSRPRLALASAAAAVLIAATGCGGDDKPTSVSAADLNKTGELWITLTPDLKQELVADAKDRFGEDHKPIENLVQAVDDNDLVQAIDDQYTNESKRDQTIYKTYTVVNDKLATDLYNDSQ